MHDAWPAQGSSGIDGGRTVCYGVSEMVTKTSWRIISRMIPDV